MTLDVLLTATTARDRQLCLDLGEQLQQRGAALRELGRVPVDAVGQHGHARSLCGLRGRPCNHVRVTRIYLEVGQKWTFACALDWPGWCRRAKGDEAAVEELLAYADRYTAAIGSPVAADEPTIVGRVTGNATTDFGAPAVATEWDLETLDDAGLDRQLQLLTQIWASFDQVVEGAPAALRKGPRGGGRDRDDVRRHVMEAERSYAPKAGARVPPRTDWEQQRAMIAEAFRRRAEGAWPPRYVLRRMAWHVLDHA